MREAFLLTIKGLVLSLLILCLNTPTIAQCGGAEAGAYFADINGKNLGIRISAVILPSGWVQVLNKDGLKTGIIITQGKTENISEKVSVNGKTRGAAPFLMRKPTIISFPDGRKLDVVNRFTEVRVGDTIIKKTGIGAYIYLEIQEG